MDTDNARAQVWEAIRSVTDPELDESIADLGFIQSVAIIQPESADPSPVVDAAVHITFRLPTYWCAANFAFMMAEDLRERVVRFPWVREVKVELVDHFTSVEINRGIAAGVSFSDSFPAELVEPEAKQANESARCVTISDSNLADLRRLFRLKAFQRRQYRLLRYLLDNPALSLDARAGHRAQSDVESSVDGCKDIRARLLAMTIAQLRDLSITDDEGAKLRTGYIDILPEFSHPHRRRDLFLEVASPSEESSGPSIDSLAFVLPSGSPLDPDHFDDHLRQLRRATINIEFNTALCTSLLKSRNRNDLAR